MDTSILSSPKAVGPGTWYAIHTTAALAKTEERKRAFIQLIKDLSQNFKCNNCKSHWLKFIQDHPLDNYRNINHPELGNDVGFFIWSHTLHNQVNKFLGKYQPTLEEAYRFWSNADAGVCFDCHDDNFAKLKSNPIIRLEPENPKGFKLIPRSRGGRVING